MTAVLRDSVIHQGAGQTSWPRRVCSVEIESTPSVFYDRDSLFCGILEHVGCSVRPGAPGVIGHVNNCWQRAIVTPEKCGSGVQARVDEALGRGNGWHPQGNVVGLCLINSLLIGRVQRRTVWPGVGGVCRVVKGDDGVDVSVREQERFEGHVLVGFASIYQRKIPERSDRTGFRMPVVERIRVDGDIIFGLTDGAQDALNSVGDDRAGVGVAELQECLVEKGARCSNDESVNPKIQIRIRLAAITRASLTQRYQSH